MKNLLKVTASILLICFALSSANAQEMASLSTGGYPEAVAANDKPTAPAANTTAPLTLTIKNSCEKPMIIFAGPKEEIRNPKVNTYGGLSKNTVYLQTGDVVCLMTNDYKPTACAVVKPGSTTVEINTSGNGISAK